MHRVLMMIVIAAMLTGCISYSMERDQAGVLDVNYRSWFKDIQAPSVQVDKEGDYSAKINADSSSPTLTAEEIAALLKAMGIAR